MFTNILLATDGSRACEAAAHMAIDMARRDGATLHAVYVADPYPYLGIGDTNPAGMQAYITSAHEHAAAAHASVMEMCGDDVKMQAWLIEHVSAVDGILRTGVEQHADLIVLGGHAHSGFRRLVPGSVAAKVLAHSTVPVLVVPSI